MFPVLSRAATLEGDDLRVVDDEDDHRGGYDLVTEDIVPAGEAQVRGQDQRGMFIAGGHELEEQVRGVLFEPDVADLIDDDQTVAPEPDQF